MEYRNLCLILFALISSILLAAVANAAVNVYLCPPSHAYFSNLSVGENFTVELIAEADAPGVTLFAFSVTWTPVNSASFVHPSSGGQLAMTGFFPQSSPDFSRLSEVAPDSTSQQATGSPGATPEIVVFTAPPLNSTGPDSLVKITFRKQSPSYPSFNLINAQAAQHSGGSSSQWVPLIIHTSYVDVDSGSATVSGPMLSQATDVLVSIGGKNYPASVAGNRWSVDIRTARPDISPQPLVVKTSRGGIFLNSFTAMDVIVSPGWYVNDANHSEHPADSDGDGIANLLDLLRLAQSYNLSSGDSKYDFRSDYNADGVVNLFDLLILGRNYQK